MLAMAARLAADGAVFELHYCTRSAGPTAFVGALQRSGFGRQVQHHFDDGDPAQRLDLPTLLGRPQAGTHVYVCGPQGLMDAVLATACAAAWPAAQLHTESFDAAPAMLAGDRGFEVQISSSGRVVPVLAGQTVVTALEAAGIELATSCRQGICGTCLTRVLTGEIDRRDHYLLVDEQAAMDQFLPCCSRAWSARLVLDLQTQPANQQGLAPRPGRRVATHNLDASNLWRHLHDKTTHSAGPGRHHLPGPGQRHHPRR